jgi:hypothetical protein
MLVQFKGQKTIINLDRVSFIEVSESEEEYCIDFYALIGRNASEFTVKRMISEDPAKKKMATWSFKSAAERDAALQTLITNSHGLTLGKEHDDAEDL